jgi:hypothetical protein
LCEHQTPELATNVLDYSSLPTPAAIPGASDLNFQVSGDGRTKPNKLGWAIGEMLPTPTTDDAGNITRESGAFQSLTRSVQMLPTPAVNDMGEGKTLEWWDDWAPRQKSSDGRPAPHGRWLAIEALRLLPTPTTEHSSGGYNPAWGHGMTLLDAAKEIVGQPGATTVPPSPDGKASSADPHPHLLSLDGLAHPA